MVLKTTKKTNIRKKNKYFRSKKLTGGNPNNRKKTSILVYSNNTYINLSDKIKKKINEIEELLYKTKNKMGENQNTYEKEHKIDSLNIIYFKRKINDIVSQYNVDKNNEDDILEKLDKIKSDISESMNNVNSANHYLPTQGNTEKKNNYWNFN